MTTFLAIAANSKLEFKEYSSAAEGGLEKSEKACLISNSMLSGKSTSQAAVKRIMCKGVLPIPGVKDVKRAQENAEALGPLTRSGPPYALVVAAFAENDDRGGVHELQ